MNFTQYHLLAQADRTTVEHRFEFAGLPQGWTAVLGAAVIIAACWSVIWMYRREARRGASSRIRMGLAAIRCLVLIALALILLQPVLATYVHRWIDSYCVVLVDDSSSMDLRDHYRTPAEAERVKSVMPSDASWPMRRADIVSHMLSADDNRFLSKLTERNRVRFAAFSDVPRILATLRSAREQSRDGDEESDDAQSSVDATSIDPTFTAQGPATNISRALRRSVDALRGAPLAGVVLLSDGGFNQGDPVDVVARYLEENRIPLHVVGIGDPAPPQNVRVVDVTAPESAFKSDPFSITAHINTAGMTGQTLVVELYDSDTSGSAAITPVESRTVIVKPDGSVDPVTFTRKRDGLGRAVYRVQVPVGETESVADDNAKQAVVNVIDDKMRVLLIAGAPSWEYRYVSRLLTRDVTFDLSCWLQSAGTDAVRDGNTIIDHLPATPEELFVYDAVVLMDPDPAEFGPGWSRAIESLVSDYGGGLLYASARKFTPEFMRDPVVKRIVQLLPVTPDPEADLILNRIGHYQRRAWSLKISDDALAHSILRVGADSTESASLWRELPGVYWHYPVLREKPVADVLIRHGNEQMRNSNGRHVLLATQFVGSGRSAFLAFDGTWRWRQSGEEMFNGFWVRMLRYLIEGKLLGGKKRIVVVTDGETIQLGSAVRVSARLLNNRFAPIEAASVDAAYQSGNVKRPFKLRPTPDRAGWYEGNFTPDRTGPYEISVTRPGPAADALTATHSIQIVRPNLEILNPRMNREALTALAERSPGGRYYDIDQMNELIDAVPDRHEATTVRTRPLQLWDRWWTLAILIGLLSIEWAVRKWVRLL